MSIEERKKEKRTKANSSKKKMELVHILADPSDKRTRSQLIKELDISRDTFYKWLKDDEFLREVSALVDKYTDLELSGVWNSLVKECSKGSLEAIKLFFEMKNRYTRQSGGALVNVNNVNGDNIDFEGIDTEELKGILQRIGGNG